MDTHIKKQYPVHTMQLSVTTSQGHTVEEDIWDFSHDAAGHNTILLHLPTVDNITVVDNETTCHNTTLCITTIYTLENKNTNLTNDNNLKITNHKMVYLLIQL